MTRPMAKVASRPFRCSASYSASRCVLTIEFIKGPDVFEIRARRIGLSHRSSKWVGPMEHSVMLIMALTAAFLFGIMVGSGLEILVRSSR
jgi:hypothetical protein